MPLTRVSLPNVDTDSCAQWPEPTLDSLSHAALILHRIYDTCHMRDNGWRVAQDCLIITEQLMQKPLWIDVSSASFHTLKALDTLMHLGIVRGFRGNDDPRDEKFNSRMYVLTSKDGNDFATHLYPILGYVTMRMSPVASYVRAKDIVVKIAEKTLRYLDWYIFHPDVSDVAEASLPPPIARVRQDVSRDVFAVRIGDFGCDGDGGGEIN